MSDSLRGTADGGLPRDPDARATRASLAAPARELPTLPLLLLFFMAGAPALVYQVVWQRALALHFGIDLYSTTITVSVFLFGLGVGSLLGGRLADALPRTAWLYAAIEVAIGLFGLASLPLIQSVGVTFAGAELSTLLAVNALLLLVPTALMGMTLPVMVKLLARRDPSIGRTISRLYGINTLGAACGAALTAYVLLGALGYAGATALAAVTNIALGIVVLLIARERPGVAVKGPTPLARTNRRVTAAAAATTDRGFTTRVATLAFLSGFVAIGLEIVLYRVIGIVLHGTVYVFGTHLAIFLLGIALGSLLSIRHVARERPLHRFALSQLAIAASVLIAFATIGHASGLPGLRHLLGASFFTYFHPSIELVSGQFDARSVYSLLDIFLWTGLFVLPPALCMGYGFPHLVGAVAVRFETVGRSVGGVYLWNIAGSALGGIVTGFVLLHHLATEGTLLLLLLLAIVTAALAFAVAGPAVASSGSSARLQPAWRWGLLAATMAAVSLTVFPRDGQLVRALHFADFPSVEFDLREDRTGVVALRRQSETIAFAQEASILGQQRLYIDGSTHGFTTPGDIGIDPDVPFALAAHAAPRRVLVIGLGDGRMAAAAASDPRVEEIVVVELKASLVELLEGTAQGQRLTERAEAVRHVVDDGRRWLLANPGERFDMVLMFPLHAAHAHSGSLFSLEFFSLLRERLKPNGLLFLKNADPYAMPATLAATFEDLVRLDRETYVASDAPLLFVPERVGLDRSALASALSASAGTIRANTAGVPLATDLAPQSEFYLSYPWRAHLSARSDVPYESDAAALERYLP